MHAKLLCDKVFFPEEQSLLQGGVHATGVGAVREILKYLIPESLEGKVIWEIGVGYPRLAFILSSLSKTSVLCNDLGKNLLKALRCLTIIVRPCY